MATSGTLTDTFFRVIGRTLVEEDKLFQYQLQQVPNPNAPVPSSPGNYDGGPGSPYITSDRSAPIAEGTIVKVSRTWEVYQSA